MGKQQVGPLYEDLDFNSPLSDVRARRLIGALGPLEGAFVAEAGCGWAELLLRIAAAEPSARVLGVDTDADAIEHGRANAVARGLADRVELRAGDVQQVEVPVADVAVCVGASHAWGGTAQALGALRERVRPGGRLLLGEGIWERPPTQAAVAALGGDPAEFGSLADLVDLAVAAGFRPLEVSQAGVEEWDSFESGYARGWERWLLANPDHPDAERIRAEADHHRERWLRGYRGVLGFAYLVLARPAAG